MFGSSGIVNVQFASSGRTSDPTGSVAQEIPCVIPRKRNIISCGKSEILSSPRVFEAELYEYFSLRLVEAVTAPCFESGPEKIVLAKIAGGI